jgi:4-hydroxybenzoate polyprenyltransferase
MLLRIALYIKKRFPVVPLFFFTSLVGCSAEYYLTQATSYRGIVAGITFLLFFLHLRLLDEFKDFEFDSAFHKDRPIQTGDISMGNIKVILVVNFIILLILGLTLNFGYLLLIPLGYSFFMFKEFFVNDFYHKNSVAYLLAHEMVFFPLYLFIFSYLNDKIYLFNNIDHFLLYVYFIIPVTLIEIGRKMNHRYDNFNKQTDDTYVFIWGEKNTIRVFFGLCTINALILAFLGNQPPIVLFAALCLSVTYFVSDQKFKNLIMKNHMLFTMLGGYTFPLLLFIV